MRASTSIYIYIPFRSFLVVVRYLLLFGNAVVGDRIDEFRLGWWSMVGVMSLSPVLLFFAYEPHRPQHERGLEGSDAPG